MNKRPFPLNAVLMEAGWCIAVTLENGDTRYLLKPGWEKEQAKPYLFKTEDEAWTCVRRLFLFCLKQANTQCLKTDKILNCAQCGRVIRARFFEYCYECIQQNDFMFQQLWQGFYHLTGSQESTFHKVALLLKMPAQEFSDVPTAFKDMLQGHLALFADIEKKNAQPAIPVKTPPRPTGLHYSRHRS